MYTTIDYRTKKALRDAVRAGEVVTVYQPGPFGGDAPKNGWVVLEGPHYPKPHTWYAQALLSEGQIVSVK